ncbi:MAG: AraC family transcriptional regulator [Bacteroidota bacterium]
MKKLIYGVLFIILSGLLWYLFIKPSDYTIRFEAKAIPGTINQTLKLWDQTLDTIHKIRQEGDLYHLRQEVSFGDSIHNYQWQIQPLTDSTSKVIVNVKDMNHSLMNKIQVPFKENDFVKRSKKTVLDFMENLNDHTNRIKVTLIGEEDIPSKYLAYVPVKVTQFQKAGGMMQNFSYLTNELVINGVKLDGPPMLEVTRWDMEHDSLYYNFGQPIIRSERLPIGTDIQYKRLFTKRALKAEYNGNYITSDRAWYALLDYAGKNNIEVEPNPVEIFYNNPNTGGAELTWKAEIYMPIKESDE